MRSSSGRRVVVTSSNATALTEQLRRIGEIEVAERFDLANTAGERELVDGLAGAWAVVAGSESYTRAVFEQLDALRAVLRFGVGYDAVDVAAASDHDIAVCTATGANADAVADMALMLMLACIRSLPALDRDVRAGAWRPAAPARDLTGATVVIVGLGAVGRAVARRLRAFDCRLVAVEPAPDRDLCAELGIELAPLDEALARADVLTLHAALTPATHHLLGPRELALLPGHAVLVNTSRGPLIDEPALVDSLAGGRLAAAGLDVFETEPLPRGHPLLALSNVILSGHVASFTELGMTRTADSIVESVAALMRGIRPAGCLNAPSWLRAAADRHAG